VKILSNNDIVKVQKYTTQKKKKVHYETQNIFHFVVSPRYSGPYVLSKVLHKVKAITNWREGES
jgi:hypothetical protein